MKPKFQSSLLISLMCVCVAVSGCVKQYQQNEKHTDETTLSPAASKVNITKYDFVNRTTQNVVSMTPLSLGDQFEFNMNNDSSSIYATERLEYQDGSNPSDACPDRCRCDIDIRGSIITVDCSAQGLTSIPQLPKTAREVSLRSNYIRSIPCPAFSGLPSLELLDISYNPMTDLNNCSFDGLLALKRLIIAECSLALIPSDVFDPLLDLQELNLAYNQLDSLDNQPFRMLGKLRSLDISYNELKTIESGTFHGLHSLNFLSLRSNLLRYHPSTFETGAFDGLPSLDTLEIQGNHAELSDNFTYPDLALSRLISLRQLSLDGFSRPMGQGFSSLTNLRVINFTDVDCYCNLQSPPVNLLANINTSQSLDLVLSHCSIDVIPRYFFDHTPTINSLDLSGNKIGFRGFEEASYGFRESNLTFLDISDIVSKSTYASKIESTTFQYLKHTRLQTLKLESNFITVVYPLAILDLPLTLKYISFYDNDILNIDFMIHFSRFNKLKVIVGSRQVHFQNEKAAEEKRDEKILGNTEYVQTKSVHSNSGSGTHEENSHVSPDLHNVEMFVDEDFCGDLDVRRPDRANFTYFPVPLPKNLEKLYMSDANLRYNIPVTRFLHNTVLKILDYSQNGVKCFGGPISGLPSLTFLDLSRNYCLRMSIYMLSYLPSLRTLLLYDNVLGQSLSEDINGTTFSALANLEKLDLHNNAIKDISEKAFALNPYLHSLNLSQNQLTYFKPSFTNHSLLNILDLSTNILRGFTAVNCQQFSDIKSQNDKFHVLISNNQFVCDCDNIPFLVLLIQQPTIFGDIESFRCQLHNGSQLVYSGLKHFLPVLGSQCVAQSIFMAVFVTFSFVVLILGISSTLYYKRWQWKYLYHLAKLRLRVDGMDIRYWPSERVFVTYDQECLFFRRFMHDEFLPRLRQEEIPFVLGEIDFPAGPLAASIAGALTQTRKTLIVLSKNIFEEPDRELEINLAIMHEIHVGRDILVPVLHFDCLHEIQGGNPGAGDEIEVDSQQSLLDVEAWGRDGGLHCYSEEEREMICDLMDTFPAEISKYLYSQIHRCLVYDGGSDLFWHCLTRALLHDG